LSCFFSNGIGDGTNIVEIHYKKEPPETAQFLEHFTVKTKAYLSSYDCKDDPIYTFKKGRWFVYLLKPAHFYIKRVDDVEEA
jgi:hypothetical protein